MPPNGFEEDEEEKEVEEDSDCRLFFDNNKDNFGSDRAPPVVANDLSTDERSDGK